MTDPIDPARAGVPLLATKLYAPRWRSGLVSRPRLIARLDQGAERKLSLISAPAGFGKTTLVAEWLERQSAGERQVAWVSLHASDNDPAQFWAYVIGAVRTIHAGVDAPALDQLPTLGPTPIETVLIAMINECARSGAPFTLVLDDYHVIEQQTIHQAVAFLLEHLPTTMHIVLISRADPPLPLARMRVRGELTELRVADLRFTPDEVAVFLAGSMDLDLSASDIARLEERTEGWIAGLQLAALSIQGNDDVDGFIQSFTGNHRYIVDYLVNEVLERQPDAVRTFLLETSVLDRLTGPLCDAVTGQHDGSSRLETLEHENLFLIPLDDERRWYRYHHLFADVLRARLRAREPEHVAGLHGLASRWFEQHGFTSEAIGHALDAGDRSHAADLVEISAPTLLRNRQEATLLGWLRSISEEELQQRPVLNNLYAGVSMQNGLFDGVLARLDEAERLVADAGPGDVSSDAIIRDPEQGRQLPGLISVHRAGYALVHGDVAGTIEHATRARAVLPADDARVHGAAAALLGLAYWTEGDLERARRSYTEGMDQLRRAGFVADSIGGMNALADIAIVKGQLHDARGIYDRALKLATDSGPGALRGVADMHIGLANLHREWNELDASRSHLQRGKELGDIYGFPQFPYRRRVAEALLLEAEGDPNRAVDLLNEAEQHYASDFHPNVRPLAALRARVWIGLGRVAEAMVWARTAHLDSVELSFLREFEHITFARALVAQYRIDQNPRHLQDASDLLDRLLIAAEAGQRTGSVIEILIVQAISLAAQGAMRRAVEAIRRALVLAEPQGYVRTFHDDPETMRALLRHCVTDGVSTTYAQRLLSSLGERAERPVSEVASGLAEPLTPRELEILRLIAAGLRNEEIADQLFIGVATVKRHIANLYGKLQVSHRTEAVARANELRLL